MSDNATSEAPSPKFDLYLTVSCGEGHGIYAFHTEQEAVDQLVAWATADGLVGTGPDQTPEEELRRQPWYVDQNGYSSWVEPHLWATPATPTA